MFELSKTRFGITEESGRHLSARKVRVSSRRENNGSRRGADVEYHTTTHGEKSSCGIRHKCMYKQSQFLYNLSRLIAEITLRYEERKEGADLLPISPLRWENISGGKGRGRSAVPFFFFPRAVFLQELSPYVRFGFLRDAPTSSSFVVGAKSEHTRPSAPL